VPLAFVGHFCRVSLATGNRLVPVTVAGHNGRMGSRGRKRAAAAHASNPLTPYLPAKRAEPLLDEMLRNVLPTLDSVTNDDGSVDPERAIPALEAGVAAALDDLRREFEILNRFDAIGRLSFREVAHDPNTYVEREHDGLLSILLVCLSVAAEFDQVSPAEPEPCTPERIEALHLHAARALHLGQLNDAFQRSDTGGWDAGRLALLREVNWGPPSWPEDQESLLRSLFDGTGGRVLRKVTGFGSDDLFAVTEALEEAFSRVSVLSMIEPRPFTMRRSGVHQLTSVKMEDADRVIDWFATGLGQKRVVDPLEAARTRRMKPILVAGEEICWAASDLLPWSLQLSFEEVLKGTPDFNPYQRYRARIVEERAMSSLASVLRPDSAMKGGQYTGSHGDGEVDGLLVVDDIAVVLEAKGQMLTTRARTGDVVRLEHNLGDILGTSSAQIGRFIRTLRIDGKVYFHNLDVTIESTQIGRMFGVVATLDELNSLAVASLEIAALGVSIDRDALPTVLSLHGIDETCRLLDEPWSLLHYLHRRRGNHSGGSTTSALGRVKISDLISV
jgi:hypothetical protein